MRTIRDVLRLRFDAGLSERQTARSLGVPRTTVQDYTARFRASGLTWPVAAGLDDGALEQVLFARVPVPPGTSRPLVKNHPNSRRGWSDPHGLDSRGREV